MVSFRRTNTFLFHPAGFNNVSAFLSQNNNELNSFLHALIHFYEQASIALKKRKKVNYTGSKTLPASIKVKETHWPKVL